MNGISAEFREILFLYRGRDIKKKAEEKEVRFTNGRKSNTGKIGDKGTFVVHVKYRQNATWQGDVIWVEKKGGRAFAVPWNCST